MLQINLSMKISKGIRINNTIWDLTNTIVGDQKYFTYEEAIEIANSLGKRLPNKDDVEDLLKLEMIANDDKDLNNEVRFYINKDLDENMFIHMPFEGYIDVRDNKLRSKYNLGIYWRISNVYSFGEKNCFWFNKVNSSNVMYVAGLKLPLRLVKDI